MFKLSFLVSQQNLQVLEIDIQVVLLVHYTRWCLVTFPVPTRRCDAVKAQRRRVKPQAGKGLFVWLAGLERAALAVALASEHHLHSL